MRTEFRPSRLLSSIGEYLRGSAKQKLVKYCPEGRHLFSPFGWDIGKKLCVNFPVGRSAPGATRPISFLIRSAQEIIFSRSAFSRGIIRATYCSGVRQGLSRRGRSPGGGGVNYCDGNWKPEFDVTRLITGVTFVWSWAAIVSGTRESSVEPGFGFSLRTTARSLLSITLPPRLWSFLAGSFDLPCGSFNLASDRFRDILRFSLQRIRFWTRTYLFYRVILQKRIRSNLSEVVNFIHTITTTKYNILTLVLFTKIYFIKV